MKISYAHLCDYAMVSVDQKPSIIGVFSKVRTSSVPVVHPQAYFVFEVELDYTEVGRPLDIRIQMVDHDGQEVLGATATINTQGSAKPGDRPTFPQILKLPPILFQKAGRYDVNIFLGPAGGAAYHVPFDVELMSAPQPPQPGAGNA